MPQACQPLPRLGLFPRTPPKDGAESYQPYKICCPNPFCLPLHSSSSGDPTSAAKLGHLVPRVPLGHVPKLHQDGGEFPEFRFQL